MTKLDENAPMGYYYVESNRGDLIGHWDGDEFLVDGERWDETELVDSQVVPVPSMETLRTINESLAELKSVALGEVSQACEDMRNAEARYNRLVALGEL